MVRVHHADMDALFRDVQDLAEQGSGAALFEQLTVDVEQSDRSSPRRFSCDRVRIRGWKRWCVDHATAFWRPRILSIAKLLAELFDLLFRRWRKSFPSHHALCKLPQFVVLGFRSWHKVSWQKWFVALVGIAMYVGDDRTDQCCRGICLPELRDVFLDEQLDLAR